MPGRLARSSGPGPGLVRAGARSRAPGHVGPADVGEPGPFAPCMGTSGLSTVVGDMAMTGDPRARDTDVEGIFEATTVVRWLATDVVRVVVAGDLDVVTVDKFGQALVLATR